MVRVVDRCFGCYRDSSRSKDWKKIGAVGVLAKCRNCLTLPPHPFASRASGRPPREINLVRFYGEVAHVLVVTELGDAWGEMTVRKIEFLMYVDGHSTTCVHRLYGFLEDHGRNTGLPNIHRVGTVIQT